MKSPYTHGIYLITFAGALSFSKLNFKNEQDWTWTGSSNYLDYLNPPLCVGEYNYRQAQLQPQLES